MKAVEDNFVKFIQYKIENLSLKNFSCGGGREFFKENVGNVSSVLKQSRGQRKEKHFKDVFAIQALSTE
jgi:hypothetical protein